MSTSRRVDNANTSNPRGGEWPIDLLTDNQGHLRTSIGAAFGIQSTCIIEAPLHEEQLAEHHISSCIPRVQVLSCIISIQDGHRSSISRQSQSQVPQRGPRGCLLLPVKTSLQPKAPRSLRTLTPTTIAKICLQNRSTPMAPLIAWQVPHTYKGEMAATCNKARYNLRPRD
jgi:hypothetical protein